MRKITAITPEHRNTITQILEHLERRSQFLTGSENSVKKKTVSSWRRNWAILFVQRSQTQTKELHQVSVQGSSSSPCDCLQLHQHKSPPNPEQQTNTLEWKREAQTHCQSMDNLNNCNLIKQMFCKHSTKQDERKTSAPFDCPLKSSNKAALKQKRYLNLNRVWRSSWWFVIEIFHVQNANPTWHGEGGGPARTTFMIFWAPKLVFYLCKLFELTNPKNTN